MRVSAHCYYADILKAKSFFEMNEILNSAIRDTLVPSSEKEQYNYDKLCKTAIQRGFKFSTHFELIC